MLKNLLKFLNSDVFSLFKWFNVEIEPGFIYLSLYFFIFYAKDSEIHFVSFAEQMKGIYIGRWYLTIRR